MAGSNEIIVKVVKARKLAPTGNFALSIPREVERTLCIPRDSKFLVKFNPETSTIIYVLIGRGFPKTQGDRR